MINIDELIQSSNEQKNVFKYQDLYLRSSNTERINSIINRDLGKIDENHSKELEETLKKDGILVFENFIDTETVDYIVKKLCNSFGYNAHVPKYSDRQLRKISDDYQFQTLSYPMNQLLEEKIILDKITNRDILSLVQSYLGCFPTLYSLNSWWYTKQNQEPYGTQKNHRDLDDYKFLAFFIYLTDVNEDNSPHVFYKGTQNGNEIGIPLKVIGKAGTAILADTFALHRADPLIRGNRLVCWWRYGLYVNDMYYHDENYNFKVDSDTIFGKIEKNKFNDHLFRAVIK